MKMTPQERRESIAKMYQISLRIEELIEIMRIQCDKAYESILEEEFKKVA